MILPREAACCSPRPGRSLGTASETEPRRTLAKRMTERQWERYRLSVAEEWPESPFKRAVIAGIEHKIEGLERRPVWPPEEGFPLVRPSERILASRAAGV